MGKAKLAAVFAAAALLIAGITGVWVAAQPSETANTTSQTEVPNVTQQDTGQDDQDSLEEPYIDGEPQTSREFARDSDPDPFTVDDGLLATDPDEPTPGTGWSSNG